MQKLIQWMIYLNSVNCKTAFLPFILFNSSIFILFNDQILLIDTFQIAHAMEDEDEWGDGGWSDDENIQSNSEFLMFQNFIIENNYWSIFQNRAELLKLDKDEKYQLSKLFKIESNEFENDSYIAYLLCSGFVCHSPKDMNGTCRQNLEILKF